MKVDPTKLFQLIAAAPKILAVRLADRFDCDIKDIENAILPHLNRRIFAHEVTGPNGLKANGYTLSDACLADVLAGQGARDPGVERRAAPRSARTRRA